MTWPADFEEKTGFGLVRELLREATVTPMGRARVEAMAFMTDAGAVARELGYVDQLRTLADSVAVPLEHLEDPAGILLRIRTPGSYATAAEMLVLRRVMGVCGALREYFTSGAGQAPSLAARFSTMPDLTAAARAVDAVVDKTGQVRDNASPALADIRRRMRAAAASMNTVMRRVIDGAVTAGIVEPDTTPAMRDGHLVIPVPAAMKRQLPGIIFGQSASGRTWFIEPAQVAQANNRLRELQIAEQKEIVEIMRALATTLRPDIPLLEEGAAEIGVVDFLCSKAHLARRLDAHLPSLADTPQMDWYGAVHPELLLRLAKSGQRPVPLNIALTATRRILVVSGPNAGGKSVCLKTVAIVQYMMQCGVLPPLYSNSHMGMFSEIFIDIGDQQSIADDLSTYSSHLRNMRVFLSRAGARSLVLVDEMGGGTEPEIGGAIAQAVLGRLNDNKVYGVVTTHYRNLKTFAADTPGLVNGAMLYDRQHLRPLFQLAIGNPGSSFALEIARKSGIPLEIIESAKQIAGSDYVSTDKYLLDLTRDRKYWSEKRLAVKEKEKRLDRLITDLEGKSGQIGAMKAEIIGQARAQAREILSSANARIEHAIRDIRAAQADKERTREIRRELEAYRRTVEQQQDAAPEPVMKLPGQRRGRKSGKGTREAAAAPVRQPDVLREGDYITVAESGLSGRIISIKGQEAEVAIGALRTVVPLKSLKGAKAPAQPKTAVQPPSYSSTGDQARQRQLEFSTELDVRGFRLDEALQAVTYFIDDAVRFSAQRVRILHGTGTGALRQGIRAWLHSCPQAASFRDEDVRLGGAGITVVEIA